LTLTPFSLPSSPAPLADAAAVVVPSPFISINKKRGEENTRLVYAAFKVIEPVESKLRVKN